MPSDNITVDGTSLGHNRRAYESEVRRQIAQLLLYISGRAVLNEIWHNGHTVRIIPTRTTRTTFRNAGAQPTNWADAEPHNARLFDGSGHLMPGRGTGRGSNVIIDYDPWEWEIDYSFGGNNTMLANWPPEFRPNRVRAGNDRTEVLLHEMVHAIEDMNGLLHPHPLGNHYDTDSEFNAILVEAVYARERDRSFRTDHQEDGPAGSGRGASAQFTSMFPSTERNDFLARVNRFRAKLPGLAARLRDVPPPNPFRGFDHEMDSPLYDWNDR